MILLALAGAASAQQRTITVSGSGRVQVVPDRFSFVVGVTTRGRAVGDAVKENSGKTAHVVAALKAAGVTDAEVQTSNFSIDQPYENGRQVSDQYVVRNTVTVTRTNPKNASDLLQAAIDAGANQAFGVRFFAADLSAARDRALEAAYRDARARAEKLASAAGHSLGDALAMTTERPASPLVGGVEAQSAPPPIEAGMSNVFATLYVTFEMK